MKKSKKEELEKGQCPVSKAIRDAEAPSHHHLAPDSHSHPHSEDPLTETDEVALKHDISEARKKGPGRNDIKALVNRIGDPQIVYTVLEDFYDRMSKDILIGYFFDGKDVKLTARRQAEFILNAAGYLTRYSGRGPSTAHLEMPPIYEGHFDRRLKLLRETLESHRLAEENIVEWIAFEENFREMVVTKEKR